MKLFIWSNPYPVNYGSSMLLVIADSVLKAKQLATTGKAYSYNEYDADVPMNVEQVEALGDPTRIVELPCAEWHKWSE